MGPMSGFDIRLVFTLAPRYSTRQYKRCVHFIQTIVFSKTIVLEKTTVFIKFVVLLKIVNDNPLFTIVKDDLR